jgi:D-alanine-D-alanine ligase-like ATP-grasp enzyme
MMAYLRKIFGIDQDPLVEEAIRAQEMQLDRLRKKEKNQLNLARQILRDAEATTNLVNNSYGLNRK